MPAPAPLRALSGTAGLILIPLLLAACGDAAQPERVEPLRDTSGIPGETSTATGAAARASTDSSAPTSNDDPRPTITADLLDAYTRGMEQEILLMRSTGSHFVSLSKYHEHGLQVAEKAGLPLPEYRGLRRAVTDVLYALFMHELYAGPGGEARLARLEPHKRDHALEMLASEPFATLSPAERDAMQARLATLRPLYGRYMEIAAIAD